jgi:hypothetical protein
MTETTLGTALAFAKHGFGVFPIWQPVTHNGQTVCACGKLCSAPAKHPIERYAPHGCYSATTVSGLIKLQWGIRTPEANVGVHCAGLIVVDVDPDDGGDESLRKLEAEHGELPLTWRSLTGGGGTHDFYKKPDGVEVSNVVAKTMKDPPLGPGIDIRTKGGYVVAPTSRHISGGVYAWSVDHHPANVPLAVAPVWLVERLMKARSSSAKGHGPDYWAELAAATHTKYCDDVLARVAGKLLREPTLETDLVLSLVLAWNAQHCVPPLDEAAVVEIFERICELQNKREEFAWRKKNKREEPRNG